MNEFFPPAGAVAPVASARERGGTAVRPMLGVNAPEERTPEVKTGRSDVQGQVMAQSPERTRSTAAADYAKIQSDIADVLADLRSPPANINSAADDANNAIVALMPNPVAILPLPPTDTRIVAFVAQVAASLARHAAQSRAAHSAATPIMIEAAAH